MGAWAAGWLVGWLGGWVSGLHGAVLAAGRGETGRYFGWACCSGTCGRSDNSAQGKSRQAVLPAVPCTLAVLPIKRPLSHPHPADASLVEMYSADPLNTGVWRDLQRCLASSIAERVTC